MRNDSLAKAIAYLGAREVPGNPGFYASQNLLGIGWWTIPRDRVESLAVDILDPRVLSWPALDAAKMPAWWTPEQRFAWLNGAGNGERYSTEEEAFDHEWDQGAPERITADLETGAEVPA